MAGPMAETGSVLSDSIGHTVTIFTPASRMATNSSVSEHALVIWASRVVIPPTQMRLVLTGAEPGYLCNGVVTISKGHFTVVIATHKHYLALVRVTEFLCNQRVTTSRFFMLRAA